MKTIAPGILLILLCGCASSPTKLQSSGNESDEAVQRRQAADAQARQTGDNRPYPEGHAGLPRNRSPEIAKSIHLGQTMSELASIMRRKGWSHAESRQNLLNRLR